jgi:hypothetical protein
MSTRKISPYFNKEVKETTRWSLPSGNEPASFCSGYFDGTGDYLSITYNAAFDLGTGDFTFETWAFVQSGFSFTENQISIICAGRQAITATGGGWNIHLFDNTPGELRLEKVPTSGSATSYVWELGTSVPKDQWIHIAVVRSSGTTTAYFNGESLGSTSTFSGVTLPVPNSLPILLATGHNGSNINFWKYAGYLSNLRLVKGTAVYTKPFQTPIDPSEAISGTSLLTCADTTFRDRSVNNFTVTASGNAVIQGKSSFTSPFLKMLEESSQGGSLFSTNIVSTYSLIYTRTFAYAGGVLAPNGDIHFIPVNANRGQKISATGVVSTYSLVYTNASGAHEGGALATNGDIHFAPSLAPVGQKISAQGIVSTYSLVYTTSFSYAGAVLSSNGDLHFIPGSADRGQKISAAGVVSTYSLVYTTSGAYNGGVLAPNGDIHFIPANATVGQKISAAGVVSTYSLVYTTSAAYRCGVLASNGDIHFIPNNAVRGQKISASGIVSTYSLVYTASDAYNSGVLAPNGDIHFVPRSANRGQKISAAGVVSTYSLVYTASGAYAGGVLSTQDEINFIPLSGNRGQKITLNSGVNFSKGILLSPFFNKY